MHIIFQFSKNNDIILNKESSLYEGKYYFTRKSYKDIQLWHIDNVSKKVIIISNVLFNSITIYLGIFFIFPYIYKQMKLYFKHALYLKRNTVKQV